MQRKKEIIDCLAEKTGMYKYQAKAFYEAFKELLVDELKEKGNMNLRGIGTFHLRDIEAYICGDPNKTGETWTIPAHTRISFTASSTLKRIFNSKGDEDSE